MLPQFCQQKYRDSQGQSSSVYYQFYFFSSTFQQFKAKLIHTHSHKGVIGQERGKGRGYRGVVVRRLKRSNSKCKTPSEISLSEIEKFEIMVENEGLKYEVGRNYLFTLPRDFVPNPFVPFLTAPMHHLTHIFSPFTPPYMPSFILYSFCSYFVHFLYLANLCSILLFRICRLSYLLYFVLAHLYLPLPFLAPHCYPFFSLTPSCPLFSPFLSSQPVFTPMQLCSRPVAPNQAFLLIRVLPSTHLHLLALWSGHRASSGSSNPAKKRSKSREQNDSNDLQIQEQYRTNLHRKKCLGMRDCLKMTCKA